MWLVVEVGQRVNNVCFQQSSALNRPDDPTYEVLSYPFNDGRARIPFRELINLLFVPDEVTRRNTEPGILAGAGLPPQHDPQCSKAADTSREGVEFRRQLHLTTRPTTRFMAFNIQLFGFLRGVGGVPIGNRSIGRPHDIEHIGGRGGAELT